MRNLAPHHRAKIEREWSETGSDDGYWIMLKAGWQWDGAHVVHEPTRTAAYRVLRNEVKPCKCADCVKELP